MHLYHIAIALLNEITHDKLIYFSDNHVINKIELVKLKIIS